MAKLGEALENFEYYSNIISLINTSSQLTAQQEQELAKPILEAPPLPFCTEQHPPSGVSVIEQTSYMTHKASEVTPTNIELGPRNYLEFSQEVKQLALWGLLPQQGKCSFKQRFMDSYEH